MCSMKSKTYRDRVRTHRLRERFLKFEPLESRAMLAGNITAFVSGGTLHLRGDSEDNEITIEQSASRSFTVSSRDGSTTINGQSEVTFTRVRKDLNISMGNGDDVVELLGSEDDPLWVVNRLRVTTGNGDDQVLLSDVRALRLNIDTGSGNDTVNMGDGGNATGVYVTKESVIHTGSGDDTLDISNSTFNRILVADMGGGTDETSVQGSVFKKTSYLRGNSGDDTLSRENNRGKLRISSYSTVENSVTSPAPITPQANNDTATVARSSNVTINVATNDTAGSGSTLNLTSIVITQQPTSGTVTVNNNGTVTYTNNGGTATSDSFRYTIKDQTGATTSPALVSITITSTFAAIADAASITENATPNTATGNVLTNDANAAGTKTVSAVNGSAASVGVTINGQFGTFRINADGTYTYTLDNSNSTVNALATGQTLTDSMNYTASDGTTTSSSTLTVTVQGQTDTTLNAVGDAGSVTEDSSTTTATGNVLTNDTNNAGTKTVSAVNGAAGSVGTTVNGQFGTFQINADGSYTYTLNNSNTTVNALNNGQTLTDTMNYTASDGTSTSSATLTITIQGNTDPAFSAINDTANITEDASPNTSTGNVLTNDTNAAGTKTVTIVNGSASNVGAVVNGQFGTFQINADGTYTYTLNNGNSTVNALADGQTLTDTLTYTASDGTTTAAATLTITIQGHTDTVLNAVADTGTVTEDSTTTTATGNVLTNDTNAAGTKTVSAVNGVAGNVGTVVNGQFGTFQINSDGTFTYTLNNSNATVNALADGQTLTDSMSYTASDGTTTSSSTLTITIQGDTDTALAAVNDAASITEDASPNTTTGNVLTNDTNAVGTKTVTAVNGATSSVGAVVNAQFGTFQINADGTFTYTLDNTNTTVNALTDGQTLTDSMSYTANDGTTSSTATLSVTINGDTDAVFAAVNDAASITEDASPNTVTGNVLTNDTNALGTKTVTAVNGAAGSVGTVVNGQFGTFQINSDGTFTYTLNNANATVNALADGQTLTDSMGYTASDGSTSSTATLTITINGDTDPTFAVVNDTASITEDATPNTVTGNVLTNDTNAAGTKTVTQVNDVAGNVGTVVNGQHGTFQINADGTYTYTLNNNNAAVDDLDDDETLTDSIEYTATDGTTTSSGTLTVTITGVTDPVFTAIADSATITEDDAAGTVNGNVLTNDINATGTKTVAEVDGDSGNVGVVVNGQFGTFLINSDGTFTYTLNNANATVEALDNGETLLDSLQYLASDGTTTSLGTLSITINGRTDPVFMVVNDTAALTEDDATNTATGNVLTNDTDPAGATSVTEVNDLAENVGSVVQGQFGTFQINADGTYTYTLNNNNSTVDALADGETLTDTIEYTATDGTTTSSGTLTVTINGNTDPAFAVVNDTNSVIEDDATNTATGNVLTNDTNPAGATSVTEVNDSAANVGSVVQGQFGTFQINSDGTYTYTLDNNNATVDALADGETVTDTIEYTATDGTTTSSGTLTVTINGSTDPVFATVNDTNSVIEDDATNTATGNVLTNDTNPAGATSVTEVNDLAANVGAVVQGQFGTFQINSDGTYTYTLDNNNSTVDALADGETLIDTIEYTATDGTTTSSGTLTVTINGNTDLVFAVVNDTNSVIEDDATNSATGNVLTNDTNPAGATSVTQVDGAGGNVGTVVQGQFGTFQINSDGTYTYTLNNANTTVDALDNGETLTDSIGYTATDGTTTSTGMLTVTINGATDPVFTAVNDTGNITEDDANEVVSGNVLSNDTNAVGTPSVTAVNGVPGNVGVSVAGQYGTFVLNSDGSFTYTIDNTNATVNALNEGETLTDTLNYIAEDDEGSSSATLTITIAGNTDE
jgi:VCBS repeat-containing protein